MAGEIRWDRVADPRFRRKRAESPHTFGSSWDSGAAALELALVPVAQLSLKPIDVGRQRPANRMKDAIPGKSKFGYFGKPRSATPSVASTCLANSGLRRSPDEPFRHLAGLVEDAPGLALKDTFFLPSVISISTMPVKRAAEHLQDRDEITARHPPGHYRNQRAERGLSASGATLVSQGHSGVGDDFADLAAEESHLLRESAASDIGDPPPAGRSGDSTMESVRLSLLRSETWNSPETGPGAL